MSELREHGTFTKKWTFVRYNSQKDFEDKNPYLTTIVEKNCLLNEGINELWTLVCSAGGTKFDLTNAYLGVGDDPAPADPTQTGLNPVTPGNQYYVGMDGGFPTFGTLQKATWQGTFTGLIANWHWQEFTVANGNSGAAVNLNRLCSDQGVKTSGQIWELTLEITLS